MAWLNRTFGRFQPVRLKRQLVKGTVTWIHYDPVTRRAMTYDVRWPDGSTTTVSGRELMPWDEETGAVAQVPMVPEAPTAAPVQEVQVPAGSLQDVLLTLDKMVGSEGQWTLTRLLPGSLGDACAPFPVAFPEEWGYHIAALVEVAAGATMPVQVRGATLLDVAARAVNEVRYVLSLESVKGEN